jgi:DNA invertase Pin-like site-specific DNA recombinase
MPGYSSNRLSFIVAELGPDVDPFMLHIYAAVAQKERSLIATRTSEALQAAKRRGIKLGRTGRLRAKENKPAADALAKNLAPVIRELKASGITSVRAIAAELNKRAIPTARGAAWHPTSVGRLLSRMP